jgi:hypothetical protein
MANQDNNRMITGLIAAAAIGLAATAMKRSEHMQEYGEKIREKTSDKMHNTDMADRMQGAFYEALGSIRGMGKSIEAVDIALSDGSHRMLQIDQLSREEERMLIGKSKSI